MSSMSLHVGHLTFVSTMLLSVFIPRPFPFRNGAVTLKRRAEPEAPSRSLETEDRLTSSSTQLHCTWPTPAQMRYVGNVAVQESVSMLNRDTSQPFRGNVVEFAVRANATGLDSRRAASRNCKERLSLRPAEAKRSRKAAKDIPRPVTDRTTALKEGSGTHPRNSP